jgi:hypothetical protein
VADAPMTNAAKPQWKTEKLMGIFNNLQWTMDNESQLSIVNYQLSILL